MNIQIDLPGQSRNVSDGSCQQLCAAARTIPMCSCSRNRIGRLDTEIEKAKISMATSHVRTVLLLPAPPFSFESDTLPACHSTYSKDKEGRCVTRLHIPNVAMHLQYAASPAGLYSQSDRGSRDL